MYRLGHYGIALLLYSTVGYALISSRSGERIGLGVIFVLLFTMLPDWDGYIASFPHRGPTHTIWFGLLVGVVVGTVAVLADYWRKRDVRSATRLGNFVGGLAVLAVLAHIIADAPNPMGVQPLYPVIDTWISLDLVSAANPIANVGLFAAGVVVNGFIWKRSEPRPRWDSINRQSLGTAFRWVRRYLLQTRTNR